MNSPNRARLRVALVGAGYVAGHHLAALKRLDFVEVVGLCDANLEGQRPRQRHGIGTVASPSPAWRSPRPQAVTC